MSNKADSSISFSKKSCPKLPGVMVNSYFYQVVLWSTRTFSKINIELVPN